MSSESKKRARLKGEIDKLRAMNARQADLLQRMDQKDKVKTRRFRELLQEARAPWREQEVEMEAEDEAYGRMVL